MAKYPFYTRQEVVADIEAFEQVRFAFEVEQEVKYICLYSDVHDEKLPNTATVDEMKARVEAFVLGAEFGIVVNMDLNEDCQLHVLEFNTRMLEGRSIVEDMSLIRSYNDVDEYIAETSEDNVFSKVVKQNVAVIDMAARKIYKYERNMVS